ncbi:MAG: hypothetical protein HYW26_00255 [Candidatus Aenigmarchaeota archaeon]|nr:hypothetical protein [Candidatus Aenigmarchaeota archaeon]
MKKNGLRNRHKIKIKSKVRKTKPKFSYDILVDKFIYSDFNSSEMPLELEIMKFMEVNRIPEKHFEILFSKVNRKFYG